MLKTFLLILTHRKSEIARVVHDHPDFIAYYFVGEPEMPVDYKVDEKDRTVYLRTPDNYESLPQKVSLAMKFAAEHFYDEIDGLFKTDDDIVLDLDRLKSCIDDNKKHGYFGIASHVDEYLSDYHFGKCESEEINSIKQSVPTCDYCSGGGYYLEKSLLKHVYENEANTIFEDVSVGITLNKNGILPYHIPIKAHGAYWQTPVSLRKRAQHPYCTCGHIYQSGKNRCPHCDEIY